MLKNAQNLHNNELHRNNNNTATSNNKLSNNYIFVSAALYV